MKKCTNCHVSIEDEAEFCEECGTPTSDSVTSEHEEKTDPQPKKVCLNCQASLEVGALFCEECGTRTLNILVNPLPKKRSQSKKKICPACRKLVELNATFCEECGNSNWKSANKVQLKKPRILRFGIIAAIVLLFIFGVTQLFNNDEVQLTEEEKAEQTIKESHIEKKYSEETTVDKTNVKYTDNNSTKWQAEPLTINDHSVEIYSNETGSIEFTGYSTDEKGEYTIVLKYTGLLMDAVISGGTHTFILADGNSIEIRDIDANSIRVTDKAKYKIYHGAHMNAEIIRIETIWPINFKLHYDVYKTSTEISKPKGTIEIPGFKNFKPKGDFSPIKRENEDMVLNLKSITHDMSKNKFQLLWEITVKKDMDKNIGFNVVHPFIGSFPSELNYVNSPGNSLFEDNTFELNTSFTVTTPLSKDAIHTVYFSLGKELFGIDLTNYKEIKELPLKPFIKRYPDPSLQVEPDIHGDVDVAGERVYDTILSEQYKYSNRPLDMIISIPVGDFKKLSFRLGAGENKNEQDKPYTVKIYGEDYYINNFVKNQNATVLFKEQVNDSTALTKHTVDISKHRVIYIDFENTKARNINKEGDLDTYPVIMQGMKVSK